MRKTPSIRFFTAVFTCLFAANLHAAPAENSGPSYGVNIRGKTIEFTQSEVLAAFDNIKTYQKVRTKSEVVNAIRQGGKILTIGGGVAMIIGGMGMNGGLGLYQTESNAITRGVASILLKIGGSGAGFSSIIFGAVGVVVGGLVWGLSSAALGDDTISGVLSSDAGTETLLSMSDENLAKVLDNKIATRIISIELGIEALAMKR